MSEANMNTETVIVMNVYLLLVFCLLVEFFLSLYYFFV